MPGSRQGSTRKRGGAPSLPSRSPRNPVSRAPQDPGEASQVPAAVVRMAGADRNLNDVDTLRMKMWRERSSHSKITGGLLVLASTFLFVVAYFHPNLAVQVASVSCFTIGIFLLVYEAEPQMRLYPASMSLLGSMQVMVSAMKQQKCEGSAVYSPEETGLTVSFAQGSDPRPSSLPPCGQGLYEAYERELGDLRGKGFDYAKLWLPRVMVDGLGLAQSVRIHQKKEGIDTVMVKPFVRSLCVNEFMTRNVCGTTGCPLVASVSETLALSSGKPVRHLGCEYDPKTQTATARLAVVA